MTLCLISLDLDVDILFRLQDLHPLEPSNGIFSRFEYFWVGERAGSRQEFVEILPITIVLATFNIRNS
jgi:hypothetical protein